MSAWAPPVGEASRWSAISPAACARVVDTMYEPARITFVDEVPLTDAGKPDRTPLRSRAAQAYEVSRR
ncbi:fatty acid--CoA ligase [Streptomyces albireticuli]|uniref:Fatty acid--CoA ligase n=1 Tax=Streptomyces albireticuli TaxID=1940 RepID=A0A1Z2KV14_9ACTN|nr:fatty acid--CoA ligase [Streptomyces albireticuli]